MDDDPRAVELLAVRIRDIASTILRAYSGREALAIAMKEPPDLIVLDLMMPELNDFDVVEQLSRDSSTAGIPIVVVTAKQITSDDRARLNGYVTTVMEKSRFDPDKFVVEVRRATSSRHVDA